MTGFFEKEPGNRSMMRLLAFLGFLLGTVVALWGMWLLTVALSAITNGGTETVPALGTIALIISAGIGLAAGGEALKVVQQRGEVRETTVRMETENGHTEERTHEVVLEGRVDSTGSPPRGGGL